MKLSLMQNLSKGLEKYTQLRNNPNVDKLFLGFRNKYEQYLGASERPVTLFLTSYSGVFGNSSISRFLSLPSDEAELFEKYMLKWLNNNMEIVLEGIIRELKKDSKDELIKRKQQLEKSLAETKELLKSLEE